MLKLSKLKNKKGFTLIEIIIVTIIIGILATMAMPQFSKIRKRMYRDRCITNLRRIAAAKEHWSLETGAADTVTPTAAQLDPYLREDIWDEDGESLIAGHEMVCPIDPDGDVATFETSYTVNAIETNPECNIDGEDVDGGTHVL